MRRITCFTKRQWKKDWKGIMGAEDREAGLQLLRMFLIQQLLTKSHGPRKAAGKGEAQ